VILGRSRHVKRVKKELLDIETWNVNRTYHVHKKTIGRKWHRIEIVGRKRLSKPEPYTGCSAL
jgi:hypothetical protein